MPRSSALAGPAAGRALAVLLVAGLLGCTLAPPRAATTLVVPAGIDRSGPGGPAVTGELLAQSDELEADYYVAPDGNDDDDGRSLDTAFATIAKAASLVEPGDVVMIKEGIYHEYLGERTWRRSGEPDAPITFRSFPGESATIDGGHVERSPDPRNPDSPELMRLEDIDWYVFDGLVLRNSAGLGLELIGDHHVVRNVVTHSNHGNGIYIIGDHNLVEDSISYGNDSWANGGESADGLKIDRGHGNVIRRVVAYDNSDDGFDLWASTDTLIEHSVAYGNGKGDEGDGNGFKMSSAGVDSGNVVRFNVAFANRRHNFDANGGGDLTVYNNTSFSAGFYGFYVPGGNGVSPSRLVNNISYGDERGVLLRGLEDAGEGGNNSWDLGIDDPGFLSTDPDDLDFLRLGPDSPAIDAGADVGAEFDGDGVDLGAYEYAPPG